MEVLIKTSCRSALSSSSMPGPPSLRIRSTKRMLGVTWQVSADGCRFLIRAHRTKPFSHPRLFSADLQEVHDNTLLFLFLFYRLGLHLNGGFSG